MNLLIKILFAVTLPQWLRAHSRGFGRQVWISLPLIFTISVWPHNWFHQGLETVIGHDIDCSSFGYFFWISDESKSIKSNACEFCALLSIYSLRKIKAHILDHIPVILSLSTSNLPPAPHRPPISLFFPQWETASGASLRPLVGVQRRVIKSVLLKPKPHPHDFSSLGFPFH